MRILLTSPFAHPYVRRGVERYVGELADWLARRGHEVTLLTTAPDHSRVERRQSGVSVRYVRSGPPFGSGRWRVDELTRTVPALTRAALSLRDFDVVEAHHFPDAAALRAVRKTRPGSRGDNLWLPGVPRRVSIDARPLSRITAMYSLRGADRILALSSHAATALREELGLGADVLAPGVDTSLYAGSKPTGDDRIVLCTAAPDDVRKKVDRLVSAFALVARDRRDVRLVLAPPSAAPAEALLSGLDEDIRRRATVHVPSGSEELAALYRGASVTVLPSVDEAFGLVLVESLAAGTPVVGIRHGAVPEVVDDPSLGSLAEPEDVPALARAILAALDVAATPGSAERCRRAAARWDWSRVGPAWEQIHGIAASP